MVDGEKARSSRQVEARRRDTRWARFRLVLAVVLALILGSWALLSDLSEGGGATPMDMQVLSVKDHYPQALAVAREWRSDAIMEDAVARFRASQQPGKLTISYGFRSPSDPVAGFLVWVKQEQSGLEITSEEFEFPADRPVRDPVDPLQLALDSPEALSIILQNGGGEFIAEHSLLPWPLGLHLEYRRPWQPESTLVWRGAFSDRATLDSEHIEIDVNSGELVD